MYLGVNYLIPMTNGTLPIQIALNAYADEGEVITTPFSYVATTSAIVWETLFVCACKRLKMQGATDTRTPRMASIS